MSKKKKTVAEKEPKTAEERVDYAFEFSLPREISEQFKRLAEEIKTPLDTLFKLFILRGIHAFLLADNAVVDPAKPMKATKGKPAGKKNKRRIGK